MTMLFRFFSPVLMLLALGIALLSASGARAGEANVAVATNFLVPAREIVAAFEAESGHSITLVEPMTASRWKQKDDD